MLQSQLRSIGGTSHLNCKHKYQLQDCTFHYECTKQQYGMNKNTVSWEFLFSCTIRRQVFIDYSVTGSKKYIPGRRDVF